MTITKAPFEQYAYAVDFADKLVNGETLSTVSVTAKRFPNGGESTAQAIATDPAPNVSGTSVIFTVLGKEAGQAVQHAGEKHLVELKVTCSSGNSYVAWVYLEIMEGV